MAVPLSTHPTYVPRCRCRRAVRLADMANDGKRFLFVDSPVQPEVRELRVVLNWFEELMARVPAK